MTGELIDLQVHYRMTMKEREEMVEDFKKTLEILQERHVEIVKDKEEKYEKVSKEKIDAENKVNVMENSYRQTVGEIKKMQDVFDKKFNIFFQDHKNILKQKDENFLKVIKERDNSEEKLRKLEKDHRIMLKEKSRME